MKQKVLTNVVELETELFSIGCKKILLVCGGSYECLDIRKQIEKFPFCCIKFSHFQPNPQYSSVVEGVRVYHESGCDAILAIGGGSAIDVAKCIKLFANMDTGQDFLKQSVVPNDIPLLAMPTTAGTGSEATRYAVVYRKGKKQSITHDSILPSVVVLEPDALKSLPDYQRKATLLDALCHGIESWWSVNSTEESRRYSEQAIKDILLYKNAYLDNSEDGNAGLLWAAHIAGKAINIAQTTAGHAMCYKLTSLYGLPHGYAAALCVEVLWQYMVEHIDGCIDLRGKGHLRQIMNRLASVFGCENPEDAPRCFSKLLASLNMKAPEIRENDIQELVTSVNPERLKNYPLDLPMPVIRTLYYKISDRSGMVAYEN